MRVFADTFNVHTSMKPEWDCQAVLFEAYWILAVGQRTDQPRLRDLAVSVRTEAHFVAFTEAFEEAWPRWGGRAPEEYENQIMLPGETGRGRDYT
eukprot:2429545-Alexandrium_andersonii.AAC.1